MNNTQRWSYGELIDTVDGVAWSYGELAGPSFGETIYAVSCLDQLVVSDSSQASLSFFPSAIEVIQIADITGSVCTFDVGISEGVNFAEAISAICQFAAAISEALSIPDLVVGFVNNPNIKPTITFTANGTTFNFVVNQSPITFVANAITFNFAVN